jgi:hypothetical protein
LFTLTENERSELADISAKANELGLRVRGLHNEDDTPSTHPLWQASNHLRAASKAITKFLRDEKATPAVPVIDQGTF